MLGKILRVSLIVGVALTFISFICAAFVSSCQDKQHDYEACKNACNEPGVGCHTVTDDSQHLLVWCPTDAGSADDSGYNYILIDRAKR